MVAPADPATGAARRAGRPAARPVAVAEAVLASEALAVRAGLRRVTEALAAAGVPEDLRGRVEIAVAEALNNVAEHAYSGAGGTIRLRIGRCPRLGDILCTIEDRGRPLPGAALPAGLLPTIGDADLPEGGFGWFLIRALGSSIRYRRAGGVNRLRFRIPRDAADAPVTVSSPEPAPRSCHEST